ncbi:MAG: hypothetical protein D6753_18655 [Planctomycetota bacterium]|nr:MAG: hypothetical protein D6753_18655 [Planctomycetota bacterium]
MDAMTASGCCTSPPLQQIHAQDFGDGRRVIFGVGMAGRGHWSASFTLVPELESWIVELACRSPVAPTWLGNTYQADDRWVANDNQGGLQRLCGGKRLELQPIAPSSRVEMDAGTIRVLPQQILPGAATTQWAFRLRVLD